MKKLFALIIVALFLSGCMTSGEWKGFGSSFTPTGTQVNILSTTTIENGKLTDSTAIRFRLTDNAKDLVAACKGVLDSFKEVLRKREELLRKWVIYGPYNTEE